MASLTWYIFMGRPCTAEESKVMETQSAQSLQVDYNNREHVEPYVADEMAAFKLQGLPVICCDTNGTRKWYVRQLFLGQLYGQGWECDTPWSDGIDVTSLPKPKDERFKLLADFTI